VDELDRTVEQLIDPVAGDRMRLSAKDFHDGPASGRAASDLANEGTLVAFVGPDHSEASLDAMRAARS
jgi:hypothetical protein